MKFIPVYLLIIFFSLNSCKSSKKYEDSKWINRNLECADQTIKSFQFKISKQIKEISITSKKLEAELLKYDCPSSQNSNCISYGAVQSCATYISSGINKYGISLTGKIKNNEKTFLQEEIEEQKQIQKEWKNLKKTKRFKKVKGDLAPVPVETPEVQSSDVQSDYNLSADQIAKESHCGFEVKSKKCKFLSIDGILNKLALLTEQCASLEQDLSMFFKAVHFNEKFFEITKIHKNVRLLETMIARLVERENVINRRPEQYKILQMMQQNKIKGVTIDFIYSVPQELTFLFKSYLKKTKKIEKLFKKNKQELIEKLRASIRSFNKFKKMKAIRCLKFSNCWNFRMCVQNYNLPGIYIGKRRKITKKLILNNN